MSDKERLELLLYKKETKKNVNKIYFELIFETLMTNQEYIYY